MKNKYYILNIIINISIIITSLLILTKIINNKGVNILITLFGLLNINSSIFYKNINKDKSQINLIIGIISLIIGILLGIISLLFW